MTERQKCLYFPLLMVNLCALLILLAHGRWGLAVIPLIGLLCCVGALTVPRWWLHARWDDLCACYQRARFGYAYREAWNLCDYLALYALPRLRHISERGIAIHFADDEVTDAEIMADILYALDLHVRYEFTGDVSAEELRDREDPHGRYARGLRLFGEHWTRMWD